MYGRAIKKMATTLAAECDDMDATLAWVATHLLYAAPPRHGNAIGRGATSVVYALDANAVIKVFVMSQEVVFCVCNTAGDSSGGAAFAAAVAMTAATLPWPLRAGIHAAAVRGLYMSRRDAREACDARDDEARALTWRAERTDARRGVRVALPSYLTDAAVAALVTNFVRPHCPHWVGATAAFRVTSDAACATLERVHCHVAHFVPRATLADVRAIVFQTLVALHAAQRTIRLKHHDAHAKNVFLVLTAARGGGALPPHAAVLTAAPNFAYEVGGVTFVVPHGGVLVKVGDYDHASAVHPRHASTRLARINDWHTADPHLGEWSTELDGSRGYDAQWFVAYLLTSSSAPLLPPGAAAWLTAVLARLGSVVAELTPYGRPVHASNVPPHEVLLDEALFGDWRAPLPPAHDATLVYADAMTPHCA